MPSDSTLWIYMATAILIFVPTLYWLVWRDHSEYVSRTFYALYIWPLLIGTLLGIGFPAGALVMGWAVLRRNH